MPEKKQIMDIAGLSAAFAESLKELSTGGRTLTLANLTKTLAKRKDLVSLLDRANTHGETVSESELESLKSLIEAAEEKRRDALRRVTDMEIDTSRERDLYRRLTATLASLARVPGNEAFFAEIEECRELFQNGAAADFAQAEAKLKRLKDRMLREDIGSRTRAADEEAAAKAAARPKSLFGRPEKPVVDETFLRLRDECAAALDDLQNVLGEDFRASVHLAKEHVTRSRDLDALIAQKTYVMSIIDGYVQRALREKDQATAFLKEVSGQLGAMEKELLASANANDEVRRENDHLSRHLENELTTFRESALTSPDFESLRSCVATQLSKMTSALQKRREEYAVRIESARKESESLKKNFRALMGRVIDKNKTLLEEIQRDSLTEILNRRSYEASLAAEFDRFTRYRKPFSVIFIDIDHFKNVNDHYGHDAGDRVLRAISRKVRDILRKPDIFARYGGEEFVVILPETALDNAVGVAHKIRALVEETVFEYEGDRVPVTISLGVTEAAPGDIEPEHIVQRADKLLYRAKQEGRNRVISDFDAK